jgi:hypothetical protein
LLSNNTDKSIIFPAVELLGVGKLQICFLSLVNRSLVLTRPDGFRISGSSGKRHMAAV